MSKIRVALVGAGWVTEHHLTAYSNLSDRAEVVAIADPDPSAREERARRWSIPQSFASAEEMLGAVAVDAVDVASPREHHAAGVRLAVSHGLPVLCQKPLAPTAAEARDLVVSLPAGARLMVHENWRFRPHYGTIRGWISGGRIGRLRQARLLALTSGLLPGADGALPALARQPMLAGLERMLLMEVLIHHVDTLRSLLGDLELVGALVGRDTPEIVGEDHATLLFEAAGAPVVAVGDFRAHGAPGGLSDRLEIQGTDGAIRLDGADLLLLRGADEVVERQALDLPADYAASYLGAIRDFLDKVEADDAAAFSAQVGDNLRTLDLVERAYALAGSRAPLPRGG